MVREVRITKEVHGDELYLYANGNLFYKRWISHDYGKVFHNKEGLTQWARENVKSKSE